MQNISIAELCTLSFCAFQETRLFGNSDGFHHDPRTRLSEDCDLDVLCTAAFRVLEFIEHHGIIRLLECIFVSLVVGYLAMRQMMTVAMSASRCVGSFLYS